MAELVPQKCSKRARQALLMTCMHDGMACASVCVRAHAYACGGRPHLLAANAGGLVLFHVKRAR